MKLNYCSYTLIYFFFTFTFYDTWNASKLVLGGWIVGFVTVIKASNDYISIHQWTVGVENKRPNR